MPSKRRELYAVLKQGRLIAFSRAGRQNEIDPEAERVVLFLHGFMARGAVFGPLLSKVRARGFEAAAFSYGPHRSFVEIADRFEEWVDKQVPKETELLLVGHSMGGLLARWFHQEAGRGQDVLHLVTLATPHAGTLSAERVPGSLAKALRPQSPILNRLSSRVPTASVLAVVAGSDRTVTPPESAAQIQGADVLRFENLGHNETLFDARVHNAVLSSLSPFEPDPEDEGKGE